MINELTVGPSDCQPRKPGSEAWKADPLEACWDLPRFGVLRRSRSPLGRKAAPRWSARSILIDDSQWRGQFSHPREHRGFVGRPTPSRTSRNQGTPCDGRQTALRPNGVDPLVPRASNAKDRTPLSVLLLGRPSLPTSRRVRVVHVEGSRGLLAPKYPTEQSPAHPQPREGDAPDGVNCWRQRGAIRCGKEREP